MIVLKAATFLVGVALLAATAHVNIVHSGGYTEPHAILLIAIAFGVGAGAVAVGCAWSSRRWFLAAWLLLAILAGEGFGMLATAERLIIGRETAQAPLRDTEQTRVKASKRVDVAAAALADVPETSPRLEVALFAKAAADAAVIEKSAQRGCARNCRALLQAQVDAAQSEVAMARADLVKTRKTAEAELGEARTVLAGIVAPASATPLADRVGVAAWIIDLVTAALGSMAANGLGVGLIAFAAHGNRHGQPVTIEPSTRQKTVVREVDHAAQFAVEALTPAPDSAADLLEIHGAYEQWCKRKGVAALPAAQIGGALAHLFDGTGVTVGEHQGRRVALGVAVKTQQSRKALGRMVTVGTVPG